MSYSSQTNKPHFQKKRTYSPPPFNPTTTATNTATHTTIDSDSENDEHSQDIPILSTEEEFIQSVKKWVSLDNQLHILNVRIKEIRESRNLTTQQIHQYVEDNNLDYPSIEISDGELILCEKREYSSLSFSYIERCLSKIIQDPSHVERILSTLRENRECYLIPDIRRSKRH